jgi:hypothetical protein
VLNCGFCWFDLGPKGFDGFMLKPIVSNFKEVVNDTPFEENRFN